MERETYQDSPEHSSYDLDQLSLGSDAEDESAEHYDFHEEFLSCDPKRIQLAHKLAKKIRRDERKLSSKLPTISKEKQISVKKPYKDRQQGSLCRMHALNAFYGEPRLTPKKFFNLCMQFDHRQGYSEPISREYFYVESDGMNIISWIVEKDPRFKTLYMSAGSSLTTSDVNSSKVAGVFEFDDKHIWYWLHQIEGDLWYHLDSKRTRQAESQVGFPHFNKTLGHIIVLRK